MGVTYRRPPCSWLNPGHYSLEPRLFLCTSNATFRFHLSLILNQHNGLSWSLPISTTSTFLASSTCAIIIIYLQPCYTLLFPHLLHLHNELSCPSAVTASMLSSLGLYMLPPCTFSTSTTPRLPSTFHILFRLCSFSLAAHIPYSTFAVASAVCSAPGNTSGSDMLPLNLMI